MFASHNNSYLYMVRGPMVDALRLPSAGVAFNATLGIFQWPEAPAFSVAFHWNSSHWLAAIAPSGWLTVLQLDGGAVVDEWTLYVGPAVAAPVLGSGAEANALVISLASGTVVGIDLDTRVEGFFYDVRLVTWIRTNQRPPSGARLTEPYVTPTGSILVGFGRYVVDIHPERPKLLLNRRCLVSELTSPPVALSASVYLHEQPKPVGNRSCGEIWEREYCSGSRLEARRRTFCEAYRQDLPFSCIKSERSIQKAMSLAWGNCSILYSAVLFGVVFVVSWWPWLRKVFRVTHSEDLEKNHNVEFFSV